jgi:chromosome segregation ATPase
LSTIRDAGELHRDDWLQAQTKEPFEAVLEGQRSIFDKIAQAFESKVSTMETLGRIMAVQDDIAGSLIDGRATQDKIDQLRKELEMVKGRLIKAQTENEGLESRMKSLAREAEQARGELEVVQIRLDAMMERERVVRNELDTSQATCSAAERERDALSEVLQADVAKKEMLIKEMEGLRGEVSSCCDPGGRRMLMAARCRAGESREGQRRSSVSR